MSTVLAGIEKNSPMKAGYNFDYKVILRGPIGKGNNKCQNPNNDSGVECPLVSIGILTLPTLIFFCKITLETKYRFIFNRNRVQEKFSPLF